MGLSSANRSSVVPDCHVVVVVVVVAVIQEFLQHGCPYKVVKHKWLEKAGNCELILSAWEVPEVR